MLAHGVRLVKDVTRLAALRMACGSAKRQGGANGSDLPLRSLGQGAILTIFVPLMRLSELPVERAATVRVIHDSAISLKLLECGIVPGSAIVVLHKAPFNGPIYIQVDGQAMAIRTAEAKGITVH